jgi:DNA-binding beta-propeller fold protein YncE
MLEPAGEIQLPAHAGPGGFDHGDVHHATGRVYVAHTANGTIEVIEGEQLRHVATLPDCQEGSGVICPPSADLVVAAARGAGAVHFIDPARPWLRSKVSVGGRPNGLAWDSRRQRVLVADVAGDSLTIVDPSRGQIVANAPLPGRPRWAVFDALRDRFLVNIRDPATVALVDAESGTVLDAWSVSSPGPHGLDLDSSRGRAFVACDGAELISLSTGDGRELGRVQIAGVPDAIWFDPAADSVYVAVATPGVIQVIDAARMSIQQTAVTEEGAQTTAFDAKRRALYVFRPKSCSVAAFRVVSQ